MKLDQTKPLASPTIQQSLIPSDGLPDSVWLWLLKDAQGFAQGQLQRYCWRGAKGGVLPGGFDANSIAAQAVAELFQPREPNTGETPAEQTFLSEDPEHLAPAPLQTIAQDATVTELEETLEAETSEIPETDMPKGWESDCRKLKEEVHHRVRRQVNRLWHLKERVVLHNLGDLAPVETIDADTISFDESLPAPGANPPKFLMEQEDRTGEQRRQKQFQAFLGKDRGLQSLYACLCAGISRHKDLARKLKVSTRVIDNRLRRLRRRATEFSRLNRSEKPKKTKRKAPLQVPNLQPLPKAA